MRLSSSGLPSSPGQYADGNLLQGQDRGVAIDVVANEPGERPEGRYLLTADRGQGVHRGAADGSCQLGSCLTPATDQALPVDRGARARSWGRDWHARLGREPEARARRSLERPAGTVTPSGPGRIR